MNIGDIIALAKAGYKMADIKELMAAELPTEAPTQEEITAQKESLNKEESDTDAVTPTDTPESVEPDEPDYKKLYEQTKRDLQEVQRGNLSKTLESNNDKSPEESFAELARQFM